MQNNEVNTMEANKEVSDEPTINAKNEAIQKTIFLTRESKGRAPEPATAKPASKPINETKSPEDLTVEGHAAYYASTKPPGRKFPASMADDMLMDMFVDPDAAPLSLPAPEVPEEPPKKKRRPAKRRR
ncbi:hypothetical protein M436DRAFT_67774 [Aureobasidium namibiae CBS 147.97]|uniref:Uncharacterized protein n=1 Tax=Aureobasidium namibiae CBS 147.97 TaxID=1043004 RepID=A0A074WG55_9PEZI